MKAILFALSVLFLLGSVRAQTAGPTVTWALFPAKAGERPAGKAEFDRACSICHGAGPDRPGTTSLQIKYEGKIPALLEERSDLSVDTVKHFIRHGIAMMPRFRKTELSDAQVDEIARYLAKRP